MIKLNNQNSEGQVYQMSDTFVPSFANTYKKDENF